MFVPPLRPSARRCAAEFPWTPNDWREWVIQTSVAKSGTTRSVMPMDDELGSNLCTHIRGDQSDSDNLVSETPDFHSHLSTTSRDCQLDSSKDMSRRSTSLSNPGPLIEQKAIFMMKRLGPAKTTPWGHFVVLQPLYAPINADQESRHPFTRQLHLQYFLLAEVLEEGTNDLDLHTEP